MKLFYSDRTVKLFQGDARELDRVGDASIDLIITSPPYWDLKHYRHGSQIGLGQTYEGYLQEMQLCISECSRVLKPGRFFCLIIGTRVSDNELTHIPAAMIPIFNRFGLALRKEIIWVKPKGTQGLWQRGTTQFLKDKPFAGCLNINIQHEFIHIYQKEGTFQHNLREPLTEKFIKETAWSVWEIPVSHQKGHPAPFPFEIPYRLTTLFSHEGELVFDPFVGSGTTLLAARYLSRRGTGVELHPGFCQIAKRNLSIGKLAEPELFKDATDSPLFKVVEV